MKNISAFGPLHRGHFQLFSTEKAPLYAELVEHLEKAVFALHADTLKRKQVQAAISEFVTQRGWEAQLRSDEDFDAGGIHISLYNRLIQCGWIVEHRDGIKVVADMDSEARLLLQALLDIKSGRVRSFGGEVLQVKTLVSSAIQDPYRNSQNIMFAGNHARRFLVNLRAIVGSLRKIEQEMKGQSSVGGMIDSFFTNYVTDTLVGDYKKLRSKNNPYRFRHDLIETVHSTLEDSLILDILAQSIEREGHAATKQDAEDLIVADLTVISDVFSSIDAHLDAIEATNSRIERRIRNVSKFLDRMGDDQTGVFIEAAKRLGGTNLSMSANLNINFDLIDTPRPLDSASLYKTRAPRRTPSVVIARQRKKDPALVMFEQEKRAYAELARVTADRVLRYLQSQMGDQSVVQGSSLLINDANEFFVFERLPHIATQFPGQLREYQVSKLPGKIENEWITCSDFEIRKVAEKVAA